jgi:hypothetical protein
MLLTSIVISSYFFKTDYYTTNAFFQSVWHLERKSSKKFHNVPSSKMPQDWKYESEVKIYVNMVTKLIKNHFWVWLS